MQNKKQSIKCPVLEQFLLPSVSASPTGRQSNVGSGFRVYPSWPSLHIKKDFAEVSLFTACLPPGIGWPWLRDWHFVPSSVPALGSELQVPLQESLFHLLGSRGGAEGGRGSSTTVQSVSRPSCCLWPWPWAALCLWVFCASVCPFL